MFSEEELQTARKNFAIVGPPVSEADIEAIFPGAFPGKEDLVQFYLRYNGGSRSSKGCVLACSNPAHKVSRDRLHEMTVEGCMSVSLDADDRLLPFRPIIRHHATMIRMYARIMEIAQLLKQNIPFAFDHSGSDICIDLQTGCVRYMDWTEYGKGSIELSPSFRDFVLQYWVNAESPRCLDC